MKEQARRVVKMSERITEDFVREHFKKDLLYNQIQFEEQKSKIHKINKLLNNASKSGNGKGRPEFILSGFSDSKELIIVVECKAETARHKSKTLNQYAEYAVDGALLYSDYLAKEYDVLSIAVSGQRLDDLEVSHFLQKEGGEAQEIFGKKLLSIADYLEGYHQEGKRYEEQEKYKEMLAYSKVLNEDLHRLRIKEDKRSLLLSGILIALEQGSFYKSYKNYTGKKLAKQLVETITEQFEQVNLQEQKKEKLKQNYAFITTHDSLIEQRNNSNKKTLEDIIDDIDRNINSFAKTYRYYDVLGQFYIEFLRYSNSDKGLGIVLTPPHITDFFVNLVNISKEDVVYDNCTGTGGFLVSAMKRMIKDAGGNRELEESIKANQLHGVEYQPEIYPLAVSNMFLHGDGKSNVLDGDCFDKGIIEEIKKREPTVGLLNPPYKSSKKDDIEELEFMLNNLETLQKGGRCVAIVPMSCLLAQKGKRLELKKRLLKKHTLKAVFSMPDELFHNSRVGVVTAVLVAEAHTPHPARNKVLFGYFKDDGFEKRKNIGRADIYKRWKKIEEEWLSLYYSPESKAGISVVKQVAAEDEWCAEAYMETDYSNLSKDDFVKTIKNYVAFQFLHQTEGNKDDISCIK